MILCCFQLAANAWAHQTKGTTMDWSWRQSLSLFIRLNKLQHFLFPDAVDAVASSSTSLNLQLKSVATSSDRCSHAHVTTQQEAEIMSTRFSIRQGNECRIEQKCQNVQSVKIATIELVLLLSLFCMLFHIGLMGNFTLLEAIYCRIKGMSTLNARLEIQASKNGFEKSEKKRRKNGTITLPIAEAINGLKCKCFKRTENNLTLKISAMHWTSYNRTEPNRRRQLVSIQMVFSFCRCRSSAGLLSQFFALLLCRCMFSNESQRTRKDWLRNKVVERCEWIFLFCRFERKTLKKKRSRCVLHMPFYCLHRRQYVNVKWNRHTYTHTMDTTTPNNGVFRNR